MTTPTVIKATVIIQPQILHTTLFLATSFSRYAVFEIPFKNYAMPLDAGRRPTVGRIEVLRALSAKNAAAQCSTVLCGLQRQSTKPGVSRPARHLPLTRLELRRVRYVFHQGEVRMARVTPATGLWIRRNDETHWQSRRQRLRKAILR